MWDSMASSFIAFSLTSRSFSSFWGTIFFISWKSHAPLFDITPSITFKKCDVILSISTQDRFFLHNILDIFQHIFWTVNRLVKKLGKLTDVVMGNVFPKYFSCFGGPVPKSGPFLIYYPTTVKPKNNHKFVVFETFEGVHWQRKSKNISKLAGRIIFPFHQNHKMAWN